MRTLATVGLIGVLLLAGCATGPDEAATAEPATESAVADFEGRDARQVIEELETTPVADRSTELMASVQPDALVISDEAGEETSLAMPTDSFYLSVAPYEDETHDCFHHSLTTCLGEMRGTDVGVKVVDAAGKVLVDERTQTEDNGFVGVWLPRDIKATLTIEAGGKSVTQPISTADDDPTCLTTVKLS